VATIPRTERRVSTALFSRDLGHRRARGLHLMPLAREEGKNSEMQI